MHSRALTSARQREASSTVTRWPERAHCMAVARPERPAPTMAMVRVGDMWGVGLQRYELEGGHVERVIYVFKK